MNDEEKIREEDNFVFQAWLSNRVIDEFYLISQSKEAETMTISEFWLQMNEKLHMEKCADSIRNVYTLINLAYALLVYPREKKKISFEFDLDEFLIEFEFNGVVVNTQEDFNDYVIPYDKKTKRMDSCIIRYIRNSLSHGTFTCGRKICFENELKNMQYRITMPYEALYVFLVKMMDKFYGFDK